MTVRALLLSLFGAALLAIPVRAQLPGVSQDVTARGQMDYAEAVGGPAEVYIGTIGLESGAVYGQWHTHPGLVWVVVTSGDLAVYGPDGCRSIYSTGSAYAAEPDTPYDLRNEAAAPVSPPLRA